MKKVVLLLVSASLFILACKDDTTPTTNSTDTFPFDGNWTGSYTGVDNGGFSFMVEENGNISGKGYSTNAADSFSISGMINSSGELVNCATSSNASMQGKLVDKTGSGTWTNSSLNAGGDWTATKQ